MNTAPKKIYRTAVDLPLVRQSLALVCEKCGAKKAYDVGTVFLQEDKDGPERFQFTNYFRCLNCDSPGPFKVVDYLKVIKEILAGKVRGKPKVFLGRAEMFDGSAHQTVAMSEEYLKGVIAKDPNNAFLYVRMGNLLRGGGREGVAVEWYERAVVLDRCDLEALSSLSELSIERGDFQSALRHSKAILEAIEMGRRASTGELTRGILSAALYLMDEEADDFRAVWDGQSEEFRDSPSGRVLHEFMDIGSELDARVQSFVKAALGGGKSVNTISDNAVPDVAYHPPVAQLLKLGEPDQGRKPVRYGKLGLARQHIPELIRMATDAELNDGDPDGDLVWAPLHAWRALAELRAEEAVVPLLGLLRRVDENEDDWVADDLPEALAGIGPSTPPGPRPAAMPRLVRLALGRCAITAQGEAWRVQWGAKALTLRLLAEHDGALLVEADGLIRRAWVLREAGAVCIALDSGDYRLAEASRGGLTGTAAEASDLVRAPFTGMLAQLLVAIGERVTRGQTLLVLLNDILDLSKVEAGKLELKQAIFAPVQLLDEIRLLFAEMAQGQRLGLKAEWQSPAAVRYRGDPVRLRQMLSNF
ncbi:MAG: hypothetical protein WCS01_08945, partial [bacterium]